MQRYGQKFRSWMTRLRCGGCPGQAGCDACVRRVPLESEEARAARAPWTCDTRSANIYELAQARSLRSGCVLGRAAERALERPVLLGYRPILGELTRHGGPKPRPTRATSRPHSLHFANAIPTKPTPSGKPGTSGDTRQHSPGDSLTRVGGFVRRPSDPQGGVHCGSSRTASTRSAPRSRRGRQMRPPSRNGGDTEATTALLRRMRRGPSLA